MFRLHKLIPEAQWIRALQGVLFLGHEFRNKKLLGC